MERSERKVGEFEIRDQSVKDNQKDSVFDLESPPESWTL